jgi:hypothetical protein
VGRGEGRTRPLWDHSLNGRSKNKGKGEGPAWPPYFARRLTA